MKLDCYKEIEHEAPNYVETSTTYSPSCFAVTLDRGGPRERWRGPHSLPEVLKPSTSLANLRPKAAMSSDKIKVA